MLNKFYDKFIFSNVLKFKHNNFFLVNTPFLIVPNDILGNVLLEANDEFSRLLYENVKSSVQKNLCKSLDLDFGLKQDNFVHFVEDFISYSGWGKLQAVDLDFNKNRAIVSLTDNPFSDLKAEKPIDHILRGMLAGFFSNIFKKEIDCVETKCCCAGEASCEFVLKESTEFDFSKKEVRRQLKL